MPGRRLLTLVSLTLFAATALSAQSRLLAVNQKDHTFQIFDPVSEKQIAVVVEDAYTGHEIAVSPDGNTAYVPIYGDSGVGKPGSDGDHIEIIDIPSAKITGTIAFSHGVRPHCAIFDRHTGMLLVSTEVDQSVAIIDPKTRKIVGSIPTGQEQSHMIVLSPDGSRLYSANVGPGTVSVMDVRARKLLKIIPVSTNAQRISISLDGHMVFTSDQTKPELVAIDTATNTVKQRIALPSVGYGTAVTPDGKSLLVAMQASDQVAVIDLKSMRMTRTIRVPKGAYEIVMNPNGKTAYASLPFENKIAVMDLTSFATTSLIPAGTFTDGLAWAAVSH